MPISATSTSFDANTSILYSSTNLGFDSHPKCRQRFASLMASGCIILKKLLVYIKFYCDASPSI